MKPRYDDGWARLYISDAIEGLRALPPESVHTCVTSPPYWSLRSYLPADHPDKARELGQEATPEEYIGNLVEVFREVRRVLRKDGTLWLNLGFTYNAQPGQRKVTDKAGPKQRTSAGSVGSPSRSVEGYKPKDLIPIPWMAGMALQADGWWLRSPNVWNKPNPMPSSVTDRTTISHEYVLMLSKASRYFWDAEAVKERGVSDHASGNGFKRPQQLARGGRGKDEQWQPTGQRNLRSVWTIATAPYPGAHYATFAPALAERCIRAGTSERGVCSDCGAPWRRVVEQHREIDTKTGKFGMHAQGLHRTSPRGAANRDGTRVFERIVESRTLGWEPTCQHNSEVIPATVLDPFAGSGTTLAVSNGLGRRSVGFDLDERSAALVAERCGRPWETSPAELEAERWEEDTLFGML